MAVTLPLNVVAGTVAPLQYVLLTIEFTFGIGFTAIVKLACAPKHELADGVTVMTPFIGADVLLLAVNEEILPVPVVPKPMVLLVLDQVKVVDVTLPLNAVAGTVAPLQYELLVMAFTFGIGLTAIVKSVGAPKHELAEGVTVITPLIVVALLLVAPKDVMFPVPDVPRPTPVFVLLQL